MSIATGVFEVASWKEDTYQELDGGGKLTRASVGGSLTGDLSGNTSVEWLMCYQKSGSARYVGLQRVEGSLHGRKGTFVIESIGEFDGGQATGTWSVVPGSGTEALAGLRGSGRFQAPLGSKATFTLDYAIE